MQYQRFACQDPNKTRGRFFNECGKDHFELAMHRALKVPADVLLRILYQREKNNIHDLFSKQRFFSTQLECCLTYLKFELHFAQPVAS